jgi:hypothetical protein
MFFHLIVLSAFCQLSVSGRFFYGWVLGVDVDNVLQNHSIDDSALALLINPHEFTQVEIEVIARHDESLVNMNSDEIGGLVELHKAQVSIDMLNVLGVEAFPLYTTLTIGLVDKEDLDPAKITHHELEDVSAMEVEDWGICVDFDMALVGLRAVVATSQLDTAWPHTLVSLYGEIDPVFFELAVEAADDGSSALGHVGASIGFESSLSQYIYFTSALDVDLGFAQNFNELLSWGAAAALEYIDQKLTIKASLAAAGRFGREGGMEISGQILRGVCAAFEIWPISVFGFGAASVLAVYEQTPSVLANCEIAVLLKLGIVELAVGYVIVPENAAKELLAAQLVWAMELKNTQDEYLSGMFFMSKIEF